MARLLTRGLGSSPGLDQNRALGRVCGLKRPAFINGRGGPRGRGGTDLGNRRGRLRETSLVVVLLVPLAWSGPVARAAGDDPDWKKDEGDRLPRRPADLVDGVGRREAGHGHDVRRLPHGPALCPGEAGPGRGHEAV